MKCFTRSSTVLVLLAGMLLNSGCASLFGPAPTSTSTSTATLIPSPIPTVTKTPKPTISPYYLEDWQNSLDDWDYFVEGPDNIAKNHVDVYTKQGQLMVKIDYLNTVLFIINTKHKYQSVQMKVEIENINGNDNLIGLLCRYDNNDGWYNYMITSNGNIGFSRVEVEGMQAENIRFGDADNLDRGEGTNILAIACNDDEISLELNGDKWGTNIDDTYTSGHVGLMIMSIDKLPVELVIKWIDISEPE